MRDLEQVGRFEWRLACYSGRLTIGTVELEMTKKSYVEEVHGLSWFHLIDSIIAAYVQFINQWKILGKEKKSQSFLSNLTIDRTTITPIIIMNAAVLIDI